MCGTKIVFLVAEVPEIKRVFSVVKHALAPMMPIVDVTSLHSFSS